MSMNNLAKGRSGAHLNAKQYREWHAKVKAFDDAVRLLKRSRVELDATARFMDKNDFCQEYTIDYDDTECDGSCLKDDCRNSVESIDDFLARL